MKYRKKPVVVEAIRWDNCEHTYLKIKKELADGIMSRVVSYKMELVKGGARATGQLVIATLEGDHLAEVGDYIIKGIEGELYPCKPGIFEKTYERV